VKPSDLFDTKVTIPDYMRSPTGLLLVEGFYTAEHFGAWMKGRFQTLTFSTGLAPGTPIVAYLRMKPAPWHEGGDITVRLDGDSDQGERRFGAQALAAAQPFLVKGHVDDDGVGKLTIEFDGTYVLPDHETRDFGVGLMGFGYAAADNAGARMDLYEAFYYSLGEAV
jgi:GNAT superfamily N-acetyltransferase